MERAQRITAALDGIRRVGFTPGLLKARHHQGIELRIDAFDSVDVRLEDVSGRTCPGTDGMDDRCGGWKPGVGHAVFSKMHDRVVAAPDHRQGASARAGRLRR